MEGGEKEEDEEDSEDKESAASSSGGEDEMEEVDSAFAEQVHRALGAAAAVGSDGEVKVNCTCIHVLPTTIMSYITPHHHNVLHYSPPP